MAMSPDRGGFSREKLEMQSRDMAMSPDRGRYSREKSEMISFSSDGRPNCVTRAEVPFSRMAGRGVKILEHGPRYLFLGWPAGVKILKHGPRYLFLGWPAGR